MLTWPTGLFQPLFYFIQQFSKSQKVLVLKKGLAAGHLDKGVFFAKVRPRRGDTAVLPVFINEKNSVLTPCQLSFNHLVFLLIHRIKRMNNLEIYAFIVRITSNYAVWVRESWNDLSDHVMKIFLPS